MKSAYDRWLKFISGPTRGRYGETFSSIEANAIMKACPPWPERNWRRDKREINKAAKKARLIIRMQYPNGAPMFAPDGMMLDDKGNRSIFDDIDE